MASIFRFIARLVFTAQLLPALMPQTVAAQVTHLTHGDVKRRYIAYLPASYAASGDRRYPVVLHYHGGGMTMAEQMLYTRMNEAADRHDFIVVYPQGIAQVVARRLLHASARCGTVASAGGDRLGWRVLTGAGAGGASAAGAASADRGDAGARHRRPGS